MKFSVFFVIIVFYIFSNSCSLDRVLKTNVGSEFIESDGNLVSKNIYVDMFRYLEIDVDANIELIQSDSLKVNVEGDKNIVDLLDVKVSNSHMVIKFKKSITHKSKLNLKIFVPTIQFVLMNGSGKFNIKSWSNEDRLYFKNNGSAVFEMSDITQIKHFIIELNGEGSFTTIGLSDKINSVHCILNGSGNINLVNFNLINIDIELNGSGKIEIGESELLNATLIGSGKIEYKGFPKIHQKIIGSGTIIQN